jgi:hypothetical protein
MSEEEIEIVAEELAKIGGTSWYPGREQGPLLRVVSDRYREQARTVIATLDRLRARGHRTVTQDNAGHLKHECREESDSAASHHLRPGASVVYRPPGDRRAYPCRIVEIRGNQAYLAPIMRTCVGWISIESLVPTEAESHPEAR